MNDCIKTKVMNGVIIQENGIIRNSKGRLIGRLIFVDDIDFNCEHVTEDNNIELAMYTLKTSMKDVELGSYAHSWHCNIAMACYDAIGSKEYDAPYGFDHDLDHKIANDAASRFMKLCFDVDTKHIPAKK